MGEPGRTEAFQTTGFPALEAVDVSRRYGQVWAVAHVSFSLERGRALLIAGRNGSGKTTLLRLLAGATRADLGEVRVHGSTGRDEIRRHAALLSHVSYAYEPLTALENLELFAKLLGRPSRRAALLEMLEEVGLEERADALVQTFSAGMHQRLALARLILQEPTVALLDEPHSALDPEGARLLDRVVLALKAKGAAVVLATHQIQRAASLCEQGIILERGRIQWSGTAAGLVAGRSGPDSMEGAL